MSEDIIDYQPPPILRAFIKDYRPGELFYSWVVGPYGSGKTTADFFKLCYMAGLQAPGPDGIRHSRAVVVRNTGNQLKDTTIASWNLWFKDGQAGQWKATERNFILRFSDVECEVMFRPLDTPDDIARVLSLEVTFAILDEFVQIPKEIVDALSARVGRYPSKRDGGATNWGIWGSSNPDLEDNWWFDYLHGESVRKFGVEEKTDAIAVYFKQPSGMSDEAENLENLPPFEAGNHEYYINQAKGKSDAWKRQFIDAEWGFSQAGRPVVASFRDHHISKVPLLYNSNLPLVIGLDPGIRGSALVFGQEDMHGRLNVLGELTQEGYGAKRLIAERLKPYLRRRFPSAQPIIAPDPAANSRGPTDERTVCDEFRRHYVVKVESNNRLPLRLDAIDHFTSLVTDVGFALQIDAHECPMLIRALKGGWRYAVDVKKDIMKGVEPEDTPYTHVGDAFGYLARYFNRQTDRELRFGGEGDKKGFHPPMKFGSGYHFS